MISVIVPVYNTEKYLEKCLDSLVNQTYKDIEIICIDDGSTDNSVSVLEKFSQKDNRIRFFQQKNEGAAGARNLGIKEANGNFITFIDSDDWIDSDYLEKLHYAITTNNCSIATASIIRYRDSFTKYRLKYDSSNIAETLEDKIKLCDIPECCYVWNKLYKSSLIKQHYFPKNLFFEDVFWLPEIIKSAEKIISVPDTNYYYRANANSIVKKKQSEKKQIDSYNAKKKLIRFFDSNNLELSKKERTITKAQKYIFNYRILKIKEFNNVETGLLFGFLPIYKKKIKTPVIKDNTVLVWEPCSVSHSEVVPGYVKYFLDLGYHVSILVTPARYKEGLFSRFTDENVTYNMMSQKEIRKYFQTSDLADVKAVMVTTVGKICDNINFSQAYNAFSPNVDKSKLLFVEHEASFAVDAGMWDENIIMLRELDYKGAKTTAINPHYFGKVKINPKNKKTNFITIGAIRPNKKNCQLIIDAVKKLHSKGINNFKVTVVGKGNLKGVPKELHQYFDIKGRLPFSKMYDEIEKSDFMLTAYDDKNPEHIRYNTSGTSGNFQLVYGFLKPCIIVETFAPLNGFDKTNTIFYKEVENYDKAMEEGINMTSEEYSQMQTSLKQLANKIYDKSITNLKNRMNKEEG